MELRFADSSHRHGISRERIRYVIKHCRSPLYPADSEDDEVLFLGDDEHFVPLEVMAVELDDGDLLVIHAMKLRRKYREAYEERTAWPRP